METAIYFILAIPVFIITILIEYYWAKRQGKEVYRFNDAITNLNIGIGNQAFSMFIKVLILGAYSLVYDNYAIFHQEYTWYSAIACLIGFDFCFYWAHRWSHKVNFLWGAHVVHHSSEEYNLSVALRQAWWHNLIAFFVFLPLPFLGFDPMLFMIIAVIHTLYQFWIHTKTVGKLHPWIEYWFNTPSHHRVHHAIEPKYIDKNHAGLLMTWDRMFGTFKEEQEEPTYGITKSINSWNPVWANLHYYKEMFDAMKRMKSWKDKIRMIFAPPGWLPEEMGGFQKPPEVIKKEYKLYDTSTSSSLNIYVGVQFSLIIIGLIAFMSHFEELTTFYKIFFFCLIILSTTICGAIFESKKWVRNAELIRLIMVVSGINSYYYLWHLDWFAITLGVSLSLFVLFSIWFFAKYSTLKSKALNA